MMFDKQTLEQILKGKKTVTRRVRRNNTRPAVPHNIHKLKIDRTPVSYGLIRIISCEKGRLGDLNEEDAVKEGFATKEEYLDYFEKVNGSKQPNLPIWIVEFELIKQGTIKNGI